MVTGIANWLVAERAARNTSSGQTDLIEFLGRRGKKKKNKKKNRALRCQGARLLTCRWELKVASFKVPQVPSFGEAQFKDCGRGMRCESAAAAIAGKQRAREKSPEKSGDGGNKYLKERLPSQLQGASMWERQSKQAQSLGWLGEGGGGECEHETEKERERLQGKAEAGEGREGGGGKEGQKKSQNEKMQKQQATSCCCRWFFSI